MKRGLRAVWAFMWALAVPWYCLCGAGMVQAATLYQVNGTNAFGFSGQGLFVVAWSQSNSYSNVSISAPLQDSSSGGPMSGTEGTAYLVSQIGPGTSAANNVAPPVQVSGLGPAFTTRQLWTGLTLPPGSYYLVFAPTTNSPMSMSPQGASSPDFSGLAGPGVTPKGEINLADVNNIAAFPPASEFLATSYSNNIFVTVTGDPGPVPAAAAAPVPLLGPSGLAALGGFFGLLAFRRMRMVRQGTMARGQPAGLIISVIADQPPAPGRIRHDRTARRFAMLLSPDAAGRSGPLCRAVSRWRRARCAAG